MKGLLVLVLALGMVACSGPPSGTPAGQGGGTPPVTIILTSPDLVVGPNHFALALLDERNQPIADAPVHLTFFDLSGAEPRPTADTAATWRRPGSEWNRGVYKADVQFERAGPFGVEVNLDRGNGQTELARTRFDVRPESATPALGSLAPRSHNLTTRDAVDPIELCTATPEVCAATAGMRQLTIDDAITQGKPVAILFATPGFCTSQTCGPQLEVFQSLASRYQSSANFIHVEIFKDPQTRTVNDTVLEWNLPSEPWVFLVDSSGRVVDKFDGITSPEEIGATLERLLG